MRGLLVIDHAVVLAVSLVAAGCARPASFVPAPVRSDSFKDGVSQEPIDVAREDMDCVRTAASGALRLTTSVMGCFGGSGGRIELVWTPTGATLTTSASDLPTSARYGRRLFSSAEALIFRTTVADIIAEREVPSGWSSTGRYDVRLDWQCDGSLPSEFTAHSDDAGPPILGDLDDGFVVPNSRDWFSHAISLYELAEGASIGSASSG